MNIDYTRHGIIEIDNNGLETTLAYDLRRSDHFYYILVGLELADISAYIQTMENNILTHKQNLLEKDPDAFNFFLSDNFSKADQIEKRYPSLLRNSLFISIYSLLETSLYTLCNYYMSKSYSRTKLTDMKGNGIFKCKNFCNHFMDVEFPEAEWKTIINYNKIRNCLVHNRGYIFHQENRTSNLNKAVKNLESKGVYLTNQSVVTLDKTACIHFLNELDNFFKKVCDQLSFLDNDKKA